MTLTSHVILCTAKDSFARLLVYLLSFLSSKPVTAVSLHGST